MITTAIKLVIIITSLVLQYLQEKNYRHLLFLHHLAKTSLSGPLPNNLIIFFQHFQDIIDI